MPKTHHHRARKIWQPLNRKSQILTTIAVLAIAVAQIHSWHTHSAQAHSSQLQLQQLPEN